MPAPGRMTPIAFAWLCFAMVGACSAAQGRHLLRGGGGGHEGEGGGRDVAAAGSAEAAVRDPSAGALQARSDTLNSPAVTADALAARQDRGLNNFLNGFDFYVDPLGPLATLTAPELQLVQAQVGRVASTVPNVTDKYDARCNGLVCDIPTQGFSCDQAAVNARKGKAAARCGAVQGTTMFNVTRATAGLNVIAGAFAGEPYTPVDPGVAAAQAQLQTAYSAGISDAGAVPLAVVRDALSTLGTEFRARTACGARLVLRADVAPSASKSCMFCACGTLTNATIPYIEWKLTSAGCSAVDDSAAAAPSSV